VYWFSKILRRAFQHNITERSSTIYWQSDSRNV